MSDVATKVDGSAAKKALSQLQARIEEEILGAVEVGAQAAFNSAKSTTAFNDRTGRLRSSIGKRRGASSGSIVVEATAPYATYVENGTSRVAPRKFMQAGADLGSAAFSVAARAGIDRAIKGHNG